MKLAYSILVEIDPSTLTRPKIPVRDRIAEVLRAHLVNALAAAPVDLRQVRVFSRATPERVKRMDVEGIVPLPDGRYRVAVRVDDERTTSRTFPTRRTAEAWADQIDPVFLPGDPVV